MRLFLSSGATMYTGKLRSSPPQLSTCVDNICTHDACRPAINFAVELMCASTVFQVSELVRVVQSNLEPIAIETEVPHNVAEDIRLFRLNSLAENEVTVDPLRKKRIKRIVSKVLSLRLADVNLRNRWGYTVLHIPAMRKEPSIILSLFTKGASASETTLEGWCAVSICRRLTRPKDYQAKTEQGLEANKGRICIDVLEREMHRNPMAGDLLISSLTMVDGLHMKLLYLED
ncbi:regulatory NPR3-like [Olea europaea subsp. europaea]|uniref:Regulatory NPR3-like n=1 Tax=Olea europaea subsp. europaea TaxID=158383 RepID=A0A8S0P8X9_OLEEU|nr:regulatory NPR3-like [Olea europaea subsp. europaea]